MRIDVNYGGKKKRKQIENILFTKLLYHDTTVGDEGFENFIKKKNKKKQQQLSTKDSKIRIYSELHTKWRSRIYNGGLKNCMLELLKQQEKQRQKDSKQQEKQRQDDFKRLCESIERQEETFGKLLECLTKENDPGNLNIFSQVSVINSVGEFFTNQKKKWHSRNISKDTNQFLKNIVKNDPRRKKKTFTKQIRGGRTWKIRKLYSSETARWSDVPRNYLNTNENIWGTKFTIQYPLAMSQPYENGLRRLNNIPQYS